MNQAYRVTPEMGSRRKWLLINAAIFREHASYQDPRIRIMLEAYERAADKRISHSEVRATEEWLDNAALGFRDEGERAAAYAVRLMGREDQFYARREILHTLSIPRANVLWVYREHLPHNKVILALAAACYEEQPLDPVRVQILMDAVEDHGTELKRTPWTKYRGFWVLDQLLELT